MTLRTTGVPTALVIATVFVASISAGQDMPVPVEQQAAIFKRAFAYDRAFAGSPTVLVVYTDAERDSDTVTQLVSAFEKVGAVPSAVKLTQLTSPPSGAAVIYIPPTTDPVLVEPFCTGNGVLSISGVPAWAEEGKVSMALGVSKYNKAKIIVNLKRLQAEGHELSSDLLKLSEVIR